MPRYIERFKSQGGKEEERQMGKTYGEELLKSIKEIEGKISEGERKEWGELSQEIKSFKEENFEEYERVLERVKEFSFYETRGEFKEEFEEWLKEGEERGIKREIGEKILRLLLLGDLVKTEKLNPPKEMKKFLEGELKKNKWIDSWTVERLMEVNPSKEDYKVLERMSELEIETYGQWDILKEKGEAYRILLDDGKFRKFKNQFDFLKEIEGEDIPSVNYLKEASALLGDEAREMLSEEAEKLIEKIASPKEREEILSRPERKKEAKELLTKEKDKCEKFQGLIEELRPEKEMKELIAQEIKKRREINWDFKWDVEKLIELNLSKDDYKVLKRMNELNLGNLGDWFQRDIIEKRGEGDKVAYQTFLKLTDKEFEETKKRVSQLRGAYGEEFSILPSMIGVLAGEKGRRISSKSFQDLVKNLEKNYNFKVKALYTLEEIFEWPKEIKEKLSSKDFQEKIKKLEETYNFKVEIKDIDYRLTTLKELSFLSRAEIERFLSPEFQKAAKGLEQNYDFTIEEIENLKEIDYFFSEGKTEKLLSKDFIEIKNKIEKNFGLELKLGGWVDNLFAFSDEELEILSSPEFKNIVKNITDILGQKTEEGRLVGSVREFRDWLSFVRGFSSEKMKVFSSPKFKEKIKKRAKMDNLEIGSKEDAMKLFNRLSDDDLKEILPPESKKKIKDIEIKYKLKEPIPIKGWIGLSDRDIERLLSDNFREKVEKIIEMYRRPRLKDFSGLKYWLIYREETLEMLSSESFKKKVEDIEEGYNIKKSHTFSDFAGGWAGWYSLEEIERISSKEFKSKIDRIEKIFGFKKVKDLYDFRKRLALSDEEMERILSKEFQDTINKIQKNYNIRKIENFDDLPDWIIPEEKIKKLLSPELVKIPKMYNLKLKEKQPLSALLETLAVLSKKEIDNLNSEEFVKRAKNFRLKFNNFYELKKFASLEQENKIFSEKEAEIGKILSDFKIEEISLSDFRKYFSYFSSKQIDKVLERNFDQDLMGKLSPLIQETPFFKQVSSELIRNLRKIRGDKWYLVFSEELERYISASLVFSYLALEKPSKVTLNKLKEKIEKSTGEKRKRYQKFYMKTKTHDFHLLDVIPGEKPTRTLIKPENANYLSLSIKLNIPFDRFGIIGKDLEGIKEEVDKRAEDIIENYSKNKDRYLPYLDSLLGYGEKYKEWLNDILKVDNLWKFKTSHLDKDLKSVLDEIKDLKIEIRKREEKEGLEVYIKNLKQHLKAEQFSKVRERVYLIKKENREKALELIEKAEKVIGLMEQEKIPAPKDISFILANKGIFKYLNLSLTWDSIRTLSRKLSQKEGKERYAGSVEVLKRPEEYLGAMDKDPSCMRVEGAYSFGALTITQGPVFIIGIKDKLGEIKGRSLLIPVKDEKGKWRFELNTTYGEGRRAIEDFAEKVEKTLRKKKKDYYKETEKIITTESELAKGELPRTKTVSSSQEPEFWRDSTRCMVKLEKEEE
ncbi:MAG: hypothetical protein DRM99_03760 [Thermoplasmata archaeon]|nr:MAG: hypothetical protein DRM99_03760 [Thermoplasmata archaeon]